MTRILTLVPADVDLAGEIEAARRACDPDTQLVARAVGLPIAPPSCAQDWTLADLAMLAAGQDAEADGFDALVVADFGDFGVAALRSLLKIPVLGAGRAALLHALTLADSVTVLAPARDLARAGKQVRDMALGERCRGVHACEDAPGLARHRATAEAVVLAGALAGLAASGLPTEASGLTHGPLVRPVPVTVKLAESFVGLGLSQSRRAWPEPERRKPELIRALAQAGTPSPGDPHARAPQTDAGG